MTGPANRRGFLRGLASLPLIGGGVTLIGQPTAAAVPVTDDLLRTYQSWLGWERMKVCRRLYGDAEYGRALDCYPVNDTAWHWHFPSGMGVDGERDKREAAARAPVILSAAGVPIGGAA